MSVGTYQETILTKSAQSLIQIKARQLCDKHGFSRSDFKDLIQELTLRLLEKAHLYDPARGASRDTFADWVITSSVRMILRDRKRIKRAAGLTALSLDVTGTSQDGSEWSLGEMIGVEDRARITFNAVTPNAGERQELLQFAMNSLPKDLAEIAHRLQTGTVASVARDMGISRRQVYRAVAGIRQYFEKVGLDHP